MSLPGRTDEEKLAALGDKIYKEQAMWFLNAFWRKFAEQEAEKIWNNVHLMAQLDTVKKAQGCAVDEFMAHHFLEKNEETLTVQKMREQLREVGIEKIRLVPLVHYLIFKYKADWHYLVNAPQGNQEEIAKAQRLLEQVQDAFEAARAKEDQARADEAAAKAASAEAKRTAEEAKRAAAEAKAAQQELEAALEALKEQEDAYKRKTEELQRRTEDGGLVARNKAKNELAQHLGEDPLPLRRAKITTEAATKKAERAANAAAEAAHAADESAKAAARAAEKAADARKAAERAVEAAQAKVAEAEAYLEEVKANPGGEGSLWWIDRELHEAKAYMPTSKGGYKKEK